MKIDTSVLEANRQVAINFLNWLDSISPSDDVMKYRRGLQGISEVFAVLINNVYRQKKYEVCVNGRPISGRVFLELGDAEKYRKHLSGWMGDLTVREVV